MSPFPGGVREAEPGDSERNYRLGAWYYHYTLRISRPNRFHFESHGDMIDGHDLHQYPAFDGEWTVVDGLSYLILKGHDRLTLRSS